MVTPGGSSHCMFCISDLSPTPTSSAKAAFSTARLVCPIRAAAFRVIGASRATHRSSGRSAANQRPKHMNVKAPASMPKKPLPNSQVPVFQPMIMLASGPRIQTTNVLMTRLLWA